jgi:hypothetical protein
MLGRVHKKEHPLQGRRTWVCGHLELLAQTHSYVKKTQFDEQLRLMMLKTVLVKE